MPFGLLVWMIIILVLCGDGMRNDFFAFLSIVFAVCMIVALILSKHLKD